VSYAGSGPSPDSCSTCSGRRVVGGFLPAPCPQCAAPPDAITADRDALRAEVAKLRERLRNGPAEPGDPAERIRSELKEARDALRDALKAARARLAVVEPIFEAAKAWHGWYGSDDEATVREHADLLWAVTDTALAAEKEQG